MAEVGVSRGGIGWGENVLEAESFDILRSPYAKVRRVSDVCRFCDDRKLLVRRWWRL